jgi:hypothetical protein
VKTRLLAAAGAAALLLASTLPAGAANTFNVQVNAATVATVAVTMNSGTNVICNPGTAVTGTIACTNTVNASGNIRTTKGGSGALTTSAPATNITGTLGNTLAVNTLKMTCADNGSVGTHGAATLASAATSTTGGTLCASWPGPNVFNYNVNLSFGIDASQVNADTYSLSSGWTVVATAT